MGDTCEICDSPMRLVDDDDGYRRFECTVCGAEVHEIDDDSGAEGRGVNDLTVTKSRPGAIHPNAYDAVYELVNAVLTYRDASTPGLQASAADRMFNAASDVDSWLAPEHQWDYEADHA